MENEKIKIKKIITHPGANHRDEVIGIAILLAMWKKQGGSNIPPIERKPPSPEELDDPEVWCIDVGLKYDPEYKNFDHHQDKDLKCSAHLIASYFELDSKFHEMYDWWNIMDLQDRFGSVYLEEELGIQNLKIFINPIEVFFIDEFSSDPSKIAPYLQSIGLKLIRETEKFEEKMEYYSTCPLLNIKREGELPLVALLNYSEETSWIDKWVEKNPVHITINFDNRGPGWSIFRYDKYKDIVNFIRVSDDERVEFVHNNGFLLKTKNLIPINELTELITLSTYEGNSLSIKKD